MKAVLCKAFGPASSLVLEEIASPSPAKNEILLDVHAAGVNFPDTLIIEGKYQFKPPFPFSPGGEAAGVVAAVGEKVAHVRPGDRVMALTGWGSFAEQVKVPGYNVMPIPEGMDFASAAAFGMTYGTSMHALKQRANLQPGETLLVLGASGGVGLAAVEIGKAMGARVIAAASTPDKLAVAKAAGADELINYSEGSLREQLKALTGGQGVDVIYDPVGGELFEEAKHFNVDKSSWAYFFYEWAGIPGTLLCGWLSDKLFKGNRGATGVVFMILVTVGTLIYWLNPAGNPAIDMAALIMIGFLIYGPVMLIGLQALELAPKKAAGTAAGFTGLFGYLGGSVAANALVGYTVDHFGWDGGFKLLIGACLLAILFLCLTLRKPAVQAAPQQAG